MVVFANLKDLQKYVNKKISETLEDEVNETVRNTLKENVVTSVYDQYTPSHYQRTGGLYQDENIESKMEDGNTLSVRNIREENGRDIAKVIEEGKGYSWAHLDDKIGARPFHQDTKDELARTGLHSEAMKKGLSKRGIKVE